MPMNREPKIIGEKGKIVDLLYVGLFTRSRTATDERIDF